MAPTLDQKIKINKWDGSALKNCLDDQCRAVFRSSLEYDESHNLINIRLFFCFLAVGFVSLALLYDYFYPFPASRKVLIVCVLAYFLLMGVLSLYTTLVEKGTFMVCYLKDPTGMDPPQEWRLSSNLNRFDDIYRLTIDYSDGKTIRKVNMEKSVADWFDTDGMLANKKFHDDVKKLHDSLFKGPKKD